MTSEIAVVNANGIALAADSAATIHGTKVYNSSNKLFTLSKFEPVAIMIYGNSALLGVPWEVLIKEFRSRLHRQSFSTIAEYAKEFWDFINENTDIFTEEAQLPFIQDRIQTILGEMEESVIQPTALELLRDDMDEIKVKTNLGNRFLQHMKTQLDNLKQSGFNEEIVRIPADKIVKKYRSLLERSLDHIKIIKDLLDATYIDLLFDIIALRLQSEQFPTSSGVVIAGYGRKEIFPTIMHFQVGIFVYDVLQRRLVEHNTNTPFQPNIYTFAQNDMIVPFLFGISESNENTFRLKLKEINTDFENELSSVFSDSGLSSQEQTQKTIMQLFHNKIESLRHELDQSKLDNLKPIIAMLGFLEKDELAEMAETLVNLTAFKRKMSSETESVGGPIDVAVISKGDGFIWVKRKHYFKPEINPSFFRNYFDQRGAFHEKRSKDS